MQRMILSAMILSAGLVSIGLLAAAPATASSTLVQNDAAPVEAGQASTWDQIKGNWVEFQGLVKEQWGKLTDDDLLQIQGERQQLVGRIQALYGISLEEAESQVTAWENSVVAP